MKEWTGAAYWTEAATAAALSCTKQWSLDLLDRTLTVYRRLVAAMASCAISSSVHAVVVRGDIGVKPWYCWDYIRDAPRLIADSDIACDSADSADTKAECQMLSHLPGSDRGCLYSGEARGYDCAV